MDDPEKDLMMSHNLPGFDLEKVASAFIANDAYREQTKAKTRWYHEILSFGAGDRDKITSETLETITKEYITRRNLNAMCFAVGHCGEAHQHIHLVFSGTEYKSKKVLRMSNKEFKELRLGMEAYQQEMFPELTHSLVYTGREKVLEKAKTKDKNARRQREYQMKKSYPEKLTEKEKLKSLVQQSYSQARSVQGFLRNLKQQRLTLYMRGGRVAGVIGRRKYRFSTLGISKDMFKALELFHQRSMEYKRLMEPGKNMEFTTGY